MDSTLILPLITGSGVAGVFCVLFILGLVYPRSVVSDKDRQIAEITADRDAQRLRADTAVAGNTAMRDIVAALREGLEMGSARRAHDEAGDHGRPGP